MKRKRTKIAVVVAVVILLLIVGSALMNGGKNEPQETEEPQEEMITSGELPEPDAPSTTGEVSYPCKLEGTDLVIESMNSYDGAFLEDGSNREVSGVTAIVLKNTGDSYIEYASIHLEAETPLNFKATALEPGAEMMVIESAATPFSPQEYEYAAADAAETEPFDLSADKLKIEEQENGTLKVTNISSEDIASARVFYKLYRAEDDIYTGGITYTANFENLKAGASAEGAPAHYVPHETKIMMAKIY